MKRVIGIILIKSMLISVFSTGFIASAYEGDSPVTADARITFSDYEVDPGEEVEMTVSIMPYTDIKLLGIELNVEYVYQRDFSYPFTLVEEKTQLPEEFETASVAQKYADVPIVFVWDSIDNLEFSANKEIVLGTFTLKVNEEARLGEYMFNLYFNEIYYSHEYEDEHGETQRELRDIEIYSGEEVELFVGEKLVVYNTPIKVPLGGAENYAYDVLVNKLLDHEETYIDNTDIAEIVEIVDFGDNSVIRIRGKELGESTILYVKSADEELEENVTTLITVVKPTAWATPKTAPDKTVYYVGEKCDKETLLNGFSMRIDYENYENKIVDNIEELSLGEYDFSTPGEKSVKVYCEDTYITLKYTVKETPEYIGSTVYSTTATEIFNVPENTSVEEFIANTNVSDRLELFDAQDNPITEGIIKTGMKAKFVLDSEVKACATISVKYDVNGDGSVGLKDLMLCKKAALGEELLSNAQLKAIGSAPNAQALVLMKNYILQ